MLSKLKILLSQIVDKARSVHASSIYYRCRAGLINIAHQTILYLPLFSLFIVSCLFISVNANAAGGIALGLRELFILQMRNKHRSGLEIATYRKDIWSMPGLKIVMV